MLVIKQDEGRVLQLLFLNQYLLHLEYLEMKNYDWW